MEGLTFLNIKIYYTHRTWFLNTVLQWKELGLLGEMIDSTTGTKEIKDEPGGSHSARKQGSTQKRKGNKWMTGIPLIRCILSASQKTCDTGLAHRRYWLTAWSQSERIPKVQSWKIWAT